ncbi:MAG: hypothetical protein H0W42_03065 [Gemmatimonadaceae bacterium]|nr:hypothetical protein [Gemmatimonadaceae bacterium]
MGYAARLNPRARTLGKDPSLVAMQRIIRGCSWIKSPLQLEFVLRRFPEDERDGVRDLMYPFCAFDLDVIRHEEEQIALVQRAEAAYGTAPVTDITSAVETAHLPEDMRRAFDVLAGKHIRATD